MLLHHPNRQNDSSCLLRFLFSLLGTWRFPCVQTSLSGSLICAVTLIRGSPARDLGLCGKTHRQLGMGPVLLPAIILFNNKHSWSSTPPTHTSRLGTVLSSPSRRPLKLVLRQVNRASAPDLPVKPLPVRCNLFNPPQSLNRLIKSDPWVRDQKIQNVGKYFVFFREVFPTIPSASCRSLML